MTGIFKKESWNCELRILLFPTSFAFFARLARNSSANISEATCCGVKCRSDEQDHHQVGHFIASHEQGYIVNHLGHGLIAG